MTITRRTLILAALFLIGCGSHEPQSYGQLPEGHNEDVYTSIHVVWSTPEEIAAKCMGKEACTQPAHPGNPWCEIYVEPYAGWDSIFKTWLIGHEVTHCMWGDWHR